MKPTTLQNYRDKQAERLFIVSLRDGCVQKNFFPLVFSPAPALSSSGSSLEASRGHIMTSSFRQPEGLSRKWPMRLRILPG